MSLISLFSPALNWSLLNISTSTGNCDGTSNCLYFNTEQQNMHVVRTVSTVPLDLAIMTGVLPPPAPTFVPVDKMMCSCRLTLL